MPVTAAQLAGLHALERYSNARHRLEAAVADEGAALLQWKDVSMRAGLSGRAVDLAWSAWTAAAEVREREAQALARATEEFHDAVRAATAEVRRG